MSTNFSDRILGPDTHTNRPAAADVPEGTLYSCTTHSKVEKVASGAWADWLTLGTPTVSPLLYQDSLALHADGDEFDSTSLTGWTLGGGLTTGDVTAVTTEPYDDTCLDIVFGAQGDRMLKPISVSDNIEISLTSHGFNNDGSDPLAAIGRIFILCMLDDSGNGYGITIYNSPNNCYLWTISAYAPGTATGLTAFPPVLAAANMPLVLKLKKEGSTITGSYSESGLNYKTGTITNSTTVTKMGLLGMHTAGGTNPRIRVGRFNVEEL